MRSTETRFTPREANTAPNTPLETKIDHGRCVWWVGQVFFFSQLHCSSLLGPFRLFEHGFRVLSSEMLRFHSGGLSFQGGSGEASLILVGLLHVSNGPYFLSSTVPKENDDGYS